ncbi:hypothetical protein MYSEV_031 [Mythimna separata entomopoxvirus 'L']|uniref:Uncharacterized protein n=1 Tax=Mythimna separata entomopoxvirus 'L' TaxID=1293572 RepID=A0A916NYC1_9POXV|nr:hypothetical protein MYSEV_031 [Mythimna separata entomopoxvirus 'L']CCU56229.1 hypothetical protein MYSEV_031 [Mythimna separata entomopoxvirus 'L']
MLKRVSIYYIKETKLIISPNYNVNTNMCIYEYNICNLSHGIYIIWDNINDSNIDDIGTTENNIIKYSKITVINDDINNTQVTNVYSFYNNYDKNDNIKIFTYNSNNIELNKLLTHTSNNKKFYGIILILLLLIICIMSFIVIKDNKKELIYEEINLININH